MSTTPPQTSYILLIRTQRLFRPFMEAQKILLPSTQRFTATAVEGQEQSINFHYHWLWLTVNRSSPFSAESQGAHNFAMAVLSQYYCSREGQNQTPPRPFPISNTFLSSQ